MQDHPGTLLPHRVEVVSTLQARLSTLPAAPKELSAPRVGADWRDAHPLPQVPGVPGEVALICREGHIALWLMGPGGDRHFLLVAPIGDT